MHYKTQGYHESPKYWWKWKNLFLMTDNSFQYYFETQQNSYQMGFAMIFSNILSQSIFPNLKS